MIPVQAQEPEDSGAPVTLIGGPMHRAAIRLGLVRNENSMPFGFAISLTLWFTVVIVASIRGVLEDLFVPTLIAAHVRLLVVIPLFFVCETMVTPAIASFARNLLATELVPDEERPKLVRVIAQLRRVVNSSLPDATLLVIAIFSTVARVRLPRYSDAETVAALHDPVVVGVYVVVAGSVFRFLFLRWMWRLVLWCWFLWSVSRLKLHLFVGHSDRAGGLGGLEGVQKKFTPLVAALASLESAMFAEELSQGMPYASLYPPVVLAVGIHVFLVFLPLFLFAPALYKAKGRGVWAYSALATRYLDDFERRWIFGAHPRGELLGSADLQSLADLTNSIQVVGGMRVVPGGAGLIRITILCTVVPMMPLLLYQYSTNELLQKVVGKFLP